MSSLGICTLGVPQRDKMIPTWLHALSIASLTLGMASAATITLDLQRHPQKMWIMDVVWPVVALFGSVIVLGAYFTYGRLAAKHTSSSDNASPGKPDVPFPIKVAKGAFHCGSGCTLGDIIAEWLAFTVPAVALWFGWKSIFAEKIFTVWILDYIFAFSLGVLFQYFTIAPMRSLGPMEGLWAALKADALSLTAWQVGMYGFMAFAKFYLFQTVFGAKLQVNTSEFWFMMQIAMIFGFLTSYPINWYLITNGIKEAM